jgi:hypothetical protein
LRAKNGERTATTDVQQIAADPLLPAPITSSIAEHRPSPRLCYLQVMAPMTRNRAVVDNAPAAALEAVYYAQRAGAGLIITEGTSPNADGLGYARMPALYTDAQIAGWKAVAEAVSGALDRTRRAAGAARDPMQGLCVAGGIGRLLHCAPCTQPRPSPSPPPATCPPSVRPALQVHAKGGKVFVQLMHSGRIGVKVNLPAGARLLGPSAIRAAGEIFTEAGGKVPHDEPEAMTAADIEHTVAGFVTAAKNAVEKAGLDGVELHGANGCVAFNVTHAFARAGRRKILRREKARLHACQQRIPCSRSAARAAAHLCFRAHASDRHVGSALPSVLRHPFPCFCNPLPALRLRLQVSPRTGACKP